jgi:hypothetical protein
MPVRARLARPTGCANSPAPRFVRVCPCARMQTPVYMSPQQTTQEKGEAYSATAADVWACGVLLFVCLLGGCQQDGRPTPGGWRMWASGTGCSMCGLRQVRAHMAKFTRNAAVGLRCAGWPPNVLVSWTRRSVPHMHTWRPWPQALDMRSPPTRNCVMRRDASRCRSPYRSRPNTQTHARTHTGMFPYDHADHPDPNSSGAQADVWLAQTKGRWREAPHLHGLVEKLSSEVCDLLDQVRRQAWRRGLPGRKGGSESLHGVGCCPHRRAGSAPASHAMTEARAAGLLSVCLHLHALHAAYREYA